MTLATDEFIRRFLVLPKGLPASARFRTFASRVGWIAYLNHLLAGGVTSVPAALGGSTAKPPVLCAIPAAAHPK
jgi:hypothetical protein